VTPAVPSTQREAGILSDQEAIERFTALYDEYHSRVYAYAVSRAGRQLADEVVSEVFLISWQRVADLPQPALPWLLGVARNVALGQFRAAARQQSIAAELVVWMSEAADGDVAAEVADRLAVLRALASLSEPDRELLTLVAWHGLSPADSAQVVGCSTAAYFVRLHRARRRLERAMDGAAEWRGADRAGPDRGSRVPERRICAASLAPDSGLAPPGVALTRGEE
jgi:RNA polymerase sigma-70 factor (ECF subfamily)